MDNKMNAAPAESVKSPNIRNHDKSLRVVASHTDSFQEGLLYRKDIHEHHSADETQLLVRPFLDASMLSVKPISKPPDLPDGRMQMRGALVKAHQQDGHEAQKRPQHGLARQLPDHHIARPMSWATHVQRHDPFGGKLSSKQRAQLQTWAYETRGEKMTLAEKLEKQAWESERLERL